MSYEQIFCRKFDVTILHNLLEQISYNNNGWYLIDHNAYKKIIFYNLHIDFFESLKEYYHKSKHYYLEREFNYKTFTTILRQVCKFNSIQINSNVRYINSKYINEYNIFIRQ